MKNHIIKFLILYLAAQAHSLRSVPDYAIVFVHLGTKVPEYAAVAVQQARLFNEKCPIYFVAPQHDIDRLRSQLSPYDVECVVAESLPRTPHHQKFIQTWRLDPHWEQGFWRYTAERYFYVEELMHTYKLGTVFHLENDVMLYVNLGDLLHVFKRHYKGIAMTFGWDMIGVAGFMYIPSIKNIREIAHYMAQYAASGKDDGMILAQMKDEYGPHCIDYLPIIFPEYAEKYELINAGGIRAHNPKRFYQHVHEFAGIFDAAPLSQYLTGLSRLNGSLPAGYVNTHCTFDVRRLSYTWERDEKGRKILYVSLKDTDKGDKWKVLQLHVHSKLLEEVRS
jgi:hypothetical protein